jgi:hypothetical protein
MKDRLKDADNFVSFSDLQLFVLLYADDTVLFAESPDALQTLLVTLERYCNDWGITVNIDKSKVIVFRRGNRNVDVSMLYNNQPLEVVNSFVYLGVALFSNGNWNHTQLRACELGSRALFMLNGVLENVWLTVDKQCYLFDTMVLPVLNYGAEIWGFHPAENIDRLHYQFCKRILHVKKSTTNAAVLGELGRVPMYIVRKERIVKYWLKIICSTDSMLYRVYSVLRLDADRERSYKGMNWAFQVKSLLSSLGMLDVWVDQDRIQPSFHAIRLRMHDQYKQKWVTDVNSASKLDSYRLFKYVHEYEHYLSAVLPTKFRTALVKFRVSSHALLIESGRYEGLDRTCRICKCCNLNCVENEYHFLLVCPAYIDLRRKYLSSYYCHWPTVFKFVHIMSTHSSFLVNRVSQYLFHAFKRRDALM